MQVTTYRVEATVGVGPASPPPPGPASGPDAGDVAGLGPDVTPIRTRPKGFGLAGPKSDEAKNGPPFSFGEPLPPALSPGVSSMAGIRSKYGQSPITTKGKRAQNSDGGGVKQEPYLQWLEQKRTASNAQAVARKGDPRATSFAERLVMFSDERKRSGEVEDEGASTTAGPRSKAPQRRTSANEWDSPEIADNTDSKKWVGRKVQAAPIMAGQTKRVKDGGWKMLRKVVRKDSVQEYERPAAEVDRRGRPKSQTVKVVQEYEDIHSKTSFHDDHFRRDDKSHREAREHEHVQIMRRHRYDRDWMRKERYDLGDRPESPRKRFMGKCYELGERGSRLCPCQRRRHRSPSWPATP